MTKATHQPRGLYFEEFENGRSIVTAGRTITESDVVQFAGLTGDFNQLHIDAQYAAQNMFGKRIAHGMLSLSVALGLAVQTGIIEGTILAFRELDCKFSQPVFLGDTIHVEIKITDKKPMARLGGGAVTMKYRVLNQDDTLVQRGNWVMLVKSTETEAQT